MFCPICKAEYRTGVNQCSDCGVSLVDALDTRGLDTSDNERIVLLWQGNDPRALAALTEALEKADIPYIDQTAKGYFIFPSLRPKAEIRVSNADWERASKLLGDLWGDSASQETEPPSSDAPAFADSDYPEEDADSAIGELEDWDETDATCEIWKGEEQDFGDVLVSCLRENRIASRLTSEGKNWRLLIFSQDETRAREIVREVVEGTPPS